MRKRYFSLLLQNKSSSQFNEKSFQSPYGGIGASDLASQHVTELSVGFQSPYGGRGRSDLTQALRIYSMGRGFNHLTVA